MNKIMLDVTAYVDNELPNNSKYQQIEKLINRSPLLMNEYLIQKSVKNLLCSQAHNKKCPLVASVLNYYKKFHYSKN